MRHLRHEEESVMVWIDQICIDQSDLTEKKAQVQLMSLIYQRAWNTVIWLGDIPADDAFDVLEDLQNMTTNTFGPLLDEEKERICNPPNMKAGGLEAIERLFSAPWFQRTWTMQEAVLSYEPWVMAGRSICHWEDCVGCTADNQSLGLFRPTTIHARNLGITKANGNDVAPIRLHGFHSANAIWNIRNTDHWNSSLMGTLVRTRHTQATNPLDNVYGTLGLCGNDISIIPDYTMEPTELWRRIAVQILNAEIQEAERMLQRGFGNGLIVVFQLLCCVDHGVDESGDLPSWAVDWSKPRATSSLAYSTSVFNCFYAGQSSATSTSVRVDEIKGILSLNAKVFDTISHLSPILETADLEAAVSDATNTALKTCIAYALAAPANQQTKLLFLGFCKVVTAGKDGSGRHSCPAAFTEILSFLCDAVTRQSPTFDDQIYTLRQQKRRLTLESLKTRSCGRTFVDLKEAFRSAVLNRRLCWTAKGHLGLVPRFAKEGDRVVVVPGSPVPFVVRRASERDAGFSYRFVGECYIDGIMHGEVMADSNLGIVDLDLV